MANQSTPLTSMSTETTSPTNIVSNTSNNDERQTKPRDPFLFYSNPSNLRRAMNFETIDFNTDESSPNDTQVVRKTRISFEKDPFAMLMDDDDFRAEMERWFQTGELQCTGQAD